MERIYTQIAKSMNVQPFLDALIDVNTSPTDYAGTLFKLGQAFGEELSRRFKVPQKITLACTVEDADYLARGILEMLSNHHSTVRLVVFWNKRFATDAEGQIKVAPIIKEYHERDFEQSSVLIITKSIISSSCVVRTNLTSLIERSQPEQIYVVAPVLLKGSTDKLEEEFDKDISSKFQYLYFAEDATKTPDGVVQPGIGGNIYQRLGYKGQDDKNRQIPQLVRERRNLNL